MKYWATETGDVLGKAILERVRSYRHWFRETGYAEMARKGWRYAHGETDAGERSSRLQPGGEGGNLVKAVINGVRPLRLRTMNSVLNEAPEMVGIASTNDAAARAQADASRPVLEHLHRVHGRAGLDEEAVALALDMGEGALVVEWDAWAGEVVAAPMDGEDGVAVHEGDLAYWTASAFDVYRDPGLRAPRDGVWVCARRWMSRWRLAAKYPEHRERILSQGTETFGDLEDLFDIRLVRGQRVESDMIPLYCFWHLDAPELPGGMEARVLEDGTLLSSDFYPYEGNSLPVHLLQPERLTLTSCGYSPLYDALGLADIANALLSAMTTNTIKAAVPPIVIYSGSGVTVGASIGTGHKVLNAARPELTPKPMEMPTTPPEAYKLMDVVMREMMGAFGLNETSMGRPPFSGMAAQAMALLDAKADQYMSGLRARLLEYRAAVATFELRAVKRFAQEPRVAQMVGKTKQWEVTEFSAETLRGVDRVHVEPVGQASQTLAGKLGLLETLRNFEVPLTAEQIVELLHTGRYDAEFEAPLANRIRIRAENEALLRGEQVPTIMARTHWIDIPEHLALLNSPGIVDRPEVVRAVLSTVAEKLDLWRTMPLDLLALLGGPPPPSAMPVPAGPMPAGAMPGPAPAPGGAPAIPEGLAPGDAGGPDVTLPEPPPMAA